MKTIKKYYLLPIICISISIIIASIYISISASIYKATSKVVIKRSKLEAPTISTPEIRNRWVWLRDGLDLKANLDSEQMLLTLFVNEKSLNIDFPSTFENFSKKHITQFRKFKNNIQIDYSGPDDNIFRISTSFHNKKGALLLNKKLITTFKKLYLAEGKEAQKDLISSLENQDLSKSSHLIEAKEKLKLSFLASSITRSKSFQILVHPNSNITKIWPKPKFLILFSIIVGLFFGIILHIFVFKK